MTPLTAGKTDCRKAIVVWGNCHNDICAKPEVGIIHSYWVKYEGWLWMDWNNWDDKGGKVFQCFSVLVNIYKLCCAPWRFISMIKGLINSHFIVSEAAV